MGPEPIGAVHGQQESCPDVRRVRDQVRELRADIAPRRPQRLIPVSTVIEAEEVQGRFGPAEDALIFITGVPRSNPNC